MNSGEFDGTPSRKPFSIDLNEAPLSSPTGSSDDDVVVVGSKPAARSAGGKLVCSGCRREFSARGSAGWKCFRCLLEATRANGGGGPTSSGGYRGVRLLDINSSPPREAEVDDAAVAPRVGEAIPSGKKQVNCDISFSSPTFKAPTHSTSSYKDRGMYLGSRLSIGSDIHCKDTESCGQFSGRNSGLDPGCRVDGKLASLSTPVEGPPQSANELYLQGLREHITERKGALGDGWLVEFEFCQNRCKTIAIYISPDGRRFESVPDVERYLGLSTSLNCVETGNEGNVFGKIQKGSHIYRRRKENSRTLGDGSNGRGQNTPRSSFDRGFLAGVRPSDSTDFSGDISTGLGSVENGGDRIHYINDGFPIQLDDFFLLSPGNVDPRPSYHNSSHIWPKDYRSIWHDRVTGSLFVCHVADGGDSGPVFKVQRYPCGSAPIPHGATVLSGPTLSLPSEKDRSIKDVSCTYEGDDDENIHIQMMLEESCPPHLDSIVCTKETGNENDANNENLSIPKVGFLSQKFPKTSGDILGQRDNVGEFLVEGGTSATVWEMVAQTFVQSCHEAYKHTCSVQFGCNHIARADDDMKEFENHDALFKFLKDLGSLCRFSYLAGPAGIPRVIQNNHELNNISELLMSWLGQDRFGLDEEFVQEIIEQIPGSTACSHYRNLNKRKEKSGLKTVESGFFHVKRKNDIEGERESDVPLRSSKRPRNEYSERRAPCPTGKPFNSKLPSSLVGDVLQVWEFWQRFSEVLGSGKQFSLTELEGELASPWIDGQCPQGSKTQFAEDVTMSQNAKGYLDLKEAWQQCCRCTGIVLAEIHGYLLKLLVGELLSKVSVHVDPNFDAGELKSRRGRKRDPDTSATLKKMKLDILPVNELTWPEIARRYILAVLAMEGNADCTEIVIRESGKVFHCLRGDGGILCGSVTGIAAIEADALLLAEAMKQIFGPLKRKDEVIKIDQKQSDTGGACPSEGKIPEWAQVLEPVRKLPTNVGARIRNCVYEALRRDPPEWAKKKLEHSISKEVYKGNASGPTKRAVVAVLAEVGDKDVQHKPVKKEKSTNPKTVSDLIAKQCQIVLRCAAAADEDRVFCNLLGRTHLNIIDNEDEGLIGYPAMVSRPLDFRSIDIRLAAGVYAGSHEAFAEDVREVWQNIRTAFRDQSTLVELAETLSQKFEDLYEREVLTLVKKTLELPGSNPPSGEAEKEKDELLASISEIPLPKAPWDDGICKVCGLDKDDDNVLLCDRCDSEYHTYCLNPPLVRIPEGNWYCPSCSTRKSLSGISSALVDARRIKKRFRKEITSKCLEILAQLADMMELKEYWELSVQERISLVKFLCDEALNSAIIRDHVDHCASLAADLQQKLRCLTSERRILNCKEEILSANLDKSTSLSNCGGNLKSDTLTSFLPVDGKMTGVLPGIGSYSSSFSGSTSQQEDGQQHNRLNDSLKESSRGILDELSKSRQCLVDDKRGYSNDGNSDSQPGLGQSSSSGSLPSGALLKAAFGSSGTISSHMSEHIASDVNMSQAGHVELIDLKNKICSLEESISSKELELLKLSTRKELLGRDSAGRLYWAIGGGGASPQILVNGQIAKRISGNWSQHGLESTHSPGSGVTDFLCGLSTGFPDFPVWKIYQFGAEADELMQWLRVDDERERELKESILLWQNNQSKGSKYNENLPQKKQESLFSSCNEKALGFHFLGTKAATILGNKFGPCRAEAAELQKHVGRKVEVRHDGRISRCECLEPLWPSRNHCFSCHMTFSFVEELAQHTYDGKCQKVTGQQTSLGKCAGKMGTVQKSSSNDNVSRFLECQQEPGCPFNFEDIKTAFITQNSLKDVVKDVGLIGSHGTPSFVPNSSPYLDDPALRLFSAKENEVGHDEAPTNFKSQHLPSNIGTNEAADMKTGGLSNNLHKFGAGTDDFRTFKSFHSSIEDKRNQLDTPKSRIVRESLLRPLVGRASEILEYLKINLLDMDAALPEEALRASRSESDKRRAWRAFTKSASTVYEMILATIVLEDAIRSEFLGKDWWYWSSPSAAAKISTLSALALRIYTLDSSILYEKALSGDGGNENSNHDCQTDKEDPQDSIPAHALKPTGLPKQRKANDSEPADTLKLKVRTSKRRKDNGN